MSHQNPRTTRCLPQASGFLRSALLLCMAIILGLTTQLARAAETGTIDGRVLNLSNGRYLSKALVRVSGTNIETLTNDFGEFELYNVPVGKVTVTATFAGQEPKSVEVTVIAGKSVSQDIGLNQAKTVTEDGTIVLDQYVVSQERFKNAAEIAVNEERRSPVMKNVVAADAFGDIPGGNVGEFVKFMPGVLVSYGSYGGSQNGYNENEATGVSVRGFDSADTSITIDGMPVSNAYPGSMTRQIGLDMMSINNASRVELIKVPTPDMPANSIGGQVNLVTKSAFEYSRPVFDFRVFFEGNSEALTTNKTPGPANKKTYKITPSGDFTVAVPINSKIGFSVTGAYEKQWNPNYKIDPTWISQSPSTSNRVFNADNGGAEVSISQPYLQRVKVNDTSSITERYSGNIKVDLRPFPGSTVAVNFQVSTVDSVESSRQLDFRLQTSNTVAAGRPTRWGSYYTIGGTAQNQISQGVTDRDKHALTKSLSLIWNYQRGPWDVSLAGSRSRSDSRYDDEKNGHFSGVDGLNMGGLGSARFDYFADAVPVKFTARNTADTADIDYTNLDNWTGNVDMKAKSGEAYSRDVVDLMKFDVKRDLDFLPGSGTYYQLALKAGVRRDRSEKEKWGRGTNFYRAFNGSTNFRPAAFRDDIYKVSPGWGLAPQEWVDPYKFYAWGLTNQAFVDTNAVFAGDLAGWQSLVPGFNATRTSPTSNTVGTVEAAAVNNYGSQAGQNKDIVETRDAWYAQFEGKALKNRLNFVAGLRQETNKRSGFGPRQSSSWNFVKNSDGTIWRDSTYTTGVRFDQTNGVLFANTAAGLALRNTLTSQGVSFPDHVITSGMLEGKIMQQQQKQRVSAKVNGDPSYTISTAYDITDQLVARVAYSRSFGQISLEDGVNGLITGGSNYTISEETNVDGNAADNSKGTIQVANPNLRPWDSTNWDFGLAYYTKTGGKLSVSYYTKTVKDFQQDYYVYRNTSPQTFNSILDSLGISPDENDSWNAWRLKTTVNGSGTQKTSGYELELNQNFGFLGTWGKRLTAFASFTKKNLANPTTPEPLVTYNSTTGTYTTTTINQSSVPKSADRFAGGGINFSYNRFSLTTKMTYRNQNEKSRADITALSGGVTNFLRRYEDAETRVDLSMSYQLTEKYSIFVYGRDITNKGRDEHFHDDLGLYPDYASPASRKKFGISCTAGIKGSF
ncbi:MAG: TonB-dependent receptor [Nibricoccus sp.]